MIPARMRYARFALLVACCWLPCSAGAAEGGDPLPRIAEARAKVRTISGTAVRTVDRTLPAERDGTKTTRLVSFAFQLPASYDVVLTLPDDDSGELDRFLSDGQRRWTIQRQDKESRTDVKEEPVGGPTDGDWRRLMALVRCDLPVLREEFTLAAQATKDGFALVLDPTAQVVRRDVLQIRIALDAAFAVKTVAIDKADGNTEWYAITMDPAGGELPAARFQWTGAAAP